MHRVVVDKVKGCTRCSLHQLHNGPVPFEGKRGATFLFLGPMSTEADDTTNRPMMDKGGNWLRHNVRKLGLLPNECGFGNVVSCRGSNKNGQPKKWEMDACRGTLKLQLEAINPRVVVLCGASAMKAFRPDWIFEEKIGWMFTINWRLFVVAPHPLACVKDHETAMKFYDCIRKVRKRARGTGQDLISSAGDWPWQCSNCGSLDPSHYDPMGVPYCDQCFDLVGREQYMLQESLSV